MKMIKKSEMKGILGMLGVILVLAIISMITTGRFEQWFGITWFSGASISDKIVFVSNTGSGSDIYSINQDGSNKNRLTSNESVIDTPVVSPNGTRIAYISAKGKQANLYSIDGRGNKKTQLSLVTGAKSNPRFSPDGKFIAYISAGKVYVGEAGGGKSSFYLPTNAEVKNTMVNRTAMPQYMDYAWNHRSLGMIGAVHDEEGNYTLTYLPTFEAEPKVMKLPPALSSDFFGLAGTVNDDIYVGAFDIDKKAVLLKYDAETDTPGMVANFGEDNLSKPALNSSGSRAVVALEKQKVLLSVDLSNLQITKLANGYFTNLMFSEDDNKILAIEMSSDNNSGNLVLIDAQNGEVKKLTEDNSVISASFAPSKKIDR